MKNSYQYTKFLVVVGILLMGVSYINFKKFEGLEIYPFFWWQLFTNPQKGSTPFSIYRIYEVNNNDIIRLSNNVDNLNETVYNSLLQALVRKIEKNEPIKETKRLLQNIGEQKSRNKGTSYILVKETYKNPSSLKLTDYEFSKTFLFSSAD
ncbi:hypothetical protein ACNFNZ_08040 [Empedobacter brevis]